MENLKIQTFRGRCGGMYLNIQQMYTMIRSSNQYLLFKGITRQESLKLVKLVYIYLTTYLCHLFSVSFWVQWSFCKKDWVFIWSNTKFVVKSVVPDLNKEGTHFFFIRNSLFRVRVEVAKGKKNLRAEVA